MATTKNPSPLAAFLKVHTVTASVLAVACVDQYSRAEVIRDYASRIRLCAAGLSDPVHLRRLWSLLLAEGHGSIETRQAVWYKLQRMDREPE